VWGGESGVTAKLAPRLGPLGVNSGQVGQQVAKATEPYKGFRVSVQLTIVDRQATIVILPTTSTLLARHPRSQRVIERKIQMSSTTGPCLSIIGIAR
jgi:large subunit ribosomal protein L12e